MGPDPLADLLAQPGALAGLLLLDNCEHLRDACTALTGRLLAGATELRVLATSREPLGLAGEREWPVRSLDIPDKSLRDRDQLARVESVQLLVDRARAVRPDLEVDDDMASVVGICRALDGIPLAIELAAGRLRSLSLADLAARLGDQLTVLARHQSAGPDETRHRTLRMTLDWSYDLLTDNQRTLARRLSVFAGGFRLDAVEAVCGDDLDVLDGIDELVAKSLVTFDPTTARYRLLEPIRQYLAERLDETGATKAIQRAHAEWVANLCKRLGSRLLENQRARSLRLKEEADNIDLALGWAHEYYHALAVRIVGSLGLYWFNYDQASGRRWCEAVIQTGPEVPPRSRAKALLSAGMVTQNDQAWDRAVVWLRKALAIYRAEELASGQAASLFWLGRALANRSTPKHDEDHAWEAMRCFEESLRLFTQLGDWIGAGWCRISFSSVALWIGDLDRAEQLASMVVQESKAAGAWSPMGRALCNLGYVARLRGDNDAALEFLQDAAALYQDLDDPWQLAGLLVELAAQKAAMGRGADALQTLAESAQLDEQLGQLPERSFRLAVAAVVHAARHQPGLSIAALGAYDAHVPKGTGWWRPGVGGGQIGWLAEAVETTRAQLDPAEVATATATARQKSVDEVVPRVVV
jgi:predicted ATPase